MEAHERRGNFIERNDWKVWAVLSVIVALFGGRHPDRRINICRG